MIKYNEFYSFVIKLLNLLCPPFDFGSRLRFLLMKPFLKESGKNNLIPWRCHIFNPNGLKLGSNSYLGYNSYYGQGNINIGNNVLIGPFVSITASNHVKENGNFRNTKFKAADVTIGDNVWIGGHVSVLAGVTIGEGSVVGAGSVIKDDVPKFSLVVGNPQRIVKQYNDEK